MTHIFAVMPVAPQGGVPAGPAGAGISRRRRRVKAAAAIMLMLSVAACQSVVPRGGQVPTASAVEEIIVPADGRHQVALLLPITGPDGDIGESITNAAKLAMESTNSEVKINLKVYDTAPGAAAAASQAISDGNKLVLGPLRSDDVVAVADIARTKNVPIISFSNDIGVAGRNAYLLGHLPSQSIDRIIRYSKKTGSTRFAAIVGNNVYGQRASSNFTKSVLDAGGIIVGVQSVDASEASVDAAIRKLKAAGPIDAILVGNTGGAARSIVPLIRRSGMKARILGTELWNVDSEIANNADMRGAWFAAVSDSYYRQYAAQYRARFDKAPLRLSSLGYDAILLTSRVTQNWRLGTTFPITNLIDPGGFIGIDGAFRFSGNGQSDRMLEVREIQKGTVAVIETAPGVFGK